MDKYISEKYSKEIFADDEFNPSKVAILENGNLAEFLCSLGPEIPQLGSIHIARVRQVFRQHRLATAEIEKGLQISVRLSNDKLNSGELVMVTISAEPWGTKPARAALGAQISGKYVNLLLARPDISRISKRSISNKTTSFSLINELKKLVPKDFGVILRRQAIFAEKRLIENEIDILLDDLRNNSDFPKNLGTISTPKKIYSGMPLIKTASLISPTAALKIVKNDTNWKFVYEQIKRASDAKFITKKNVVIWFQSANALTAIDIDSAGSKMGPSELASHVSEVIMNQIRLRQISGIIVVDTPRLSKTDQKKFQEACQKHALSDIRHPDIYGIGPAGLLEMTVRHRHMPLFERIKTMSFIS